MARLKYLSELGNTPGHIQHWSANRLAELVGHHAVIVDRRSPLPWTAVAAEIAPAP